jgi:predicted small lipoprotein YifL
LAQELLCILVTQRTDSPAREDSIGRGILAIVRGTGIRCRLAAGPRNEMPFRRRNLYDSLPSMAATASRTFRVHMRSTFGCALLALCCFGARSALAGCGIVGPLYLLSSDTVDWAIAIGAGQNCIQGLRLRTATLDSVIIASPAQHGDLSIHGTGFEYRANSGFTGRDSFVIAVSGINKRVPGQSTIRVDVSVR